MEDNQKRHKRRERSITEKESNKWLVSLKAAAHLQEELSESQVISVGDSEADIYDLFLKAKELKQGLLIRACEDRRVEHPEKYLWSHIENQAIGGEVTIQVSRHAGKKARKAVLSLRYGLVKLHPPQSRYQEKLAANEIWAVLAREDRPPEGEKAIEWLLLTSVPVNSIGDACQRMEWYTCRWVIEMYHKVLKSGCRVEERQFTDLENLKRYLALDAIVAWRVLYLTLLSRDTPDIPCTVILETYEWQALYCFIHKTNQPPDDTPTLKQTTLWIAQLGGFLGRKSDGNPGTITIWRGLQRLTDIAEAWLVFLPQEHNCG
jgi:hypothetical protein